MKKPLFRRLLWGGALSAFALTPSCAAQTATPGETFGADASKEFARTFWVDDVQINGDGSKEKPFSTIAAALKIAKPGHAVMLREGVYRESLKLPSGAPNKPFALLAAPGERAVVSGFEPIPNWKSFRDQIQVATLSFQPDGLFVNHTMQPLAQSPNEGWWMVENVATEKSRRLSDPSNAKNWPADLSGAHALFLLQRGNVFGSGRIASQDKANSSLSIEGRAPVQAGDKYQLKNHVSLLDRPGEWAFAKTGNNEFQIYFWPIKADDLRNVQTRRAGSALVSGMGVQNVRVEGLEVVGGQGDGISFGNGASGITVSRCIVAGNGKGGIRLRGVSDAAVTRSIVVNNYTGINVASAKNVLIENNEVALNGMDGIVIAGDISGNYGKPEGNPDDTTQNVVVKRNYVHHHLLAGHPDNFQMFRGVRDVKLVENLAIGGGQTLMTEDVDGGELVGNVFLSSVANMVLFGHSNSNDWKVRGNTFVHPGYNAFSFTGKNYDVRENVIVGDVGTLSPTYQGHNNVFTSLPRGPKFEKFASVEAMPQEKGSQVETSPLRNAPRAHGVSDDLTKATRDTLFLREVSGFKVGDTIEINWDGVARRLTAVEAATGVKRGKPQKLTKISFTPALPALPSRYAIVANWGENQDLRFDPHLVAKTPNGQSIGSLIDVAAFQRGDFDGDGKRDLPELPADIAAGLPNPNALLTPMF